MPLLEFKNTEKYIVTSTYWKEDTSEFKVLHVILVELGQGLVVEGPEDRLEREQTVQTLEQTQKLRPSSV